MMWKIATTSMLVFRNLDCLSLVVCSNTTLLKLQTVLFLFFSKFRASKSGVRLIVGCGLYTDVYSIFPWTVQCLTGGHCGNWVTGHFVAMCPVFWHLWDLDFRWKQLSGVWFLLPHLKHSGTVPFSTFFTTESPCTTEVSFSVSSAAQAFSTADCNTRDDSTSNFLLTTG